VSKAHLLTSLFIVSILSACIMQPTDSGSGSWQDYSARTSQLNNWEVSGKLGFRSAEKGGSVSLNWTQRQDNYQLQLSGPFGAGSVNISGNSQIAEMLYDNTVYRQPPQQLAAQLTGVPLPVDALSWWARGLPSPTQPAATDLGSSPEGLTLGFEQGGWQLAFSQYRQTDAGSLPGKIVGTHQAQGDRRYSFKLVISGWSFNQE